MTADCRCSRGALGPHEDWAYHSPEACGRTREDYEAARDRARRLDG